jgi:hypothetical protein
VRRVARLSEMLGMLVVWAVLVVRAALVPRRAGGRGARRRTAPS